MNKINNNEIDNNEIDNELNDLDTNDSDYFESENNQDDLTDIDDENEDDLGNFQDEEDEEEDDENEYDNYSIGYFTVDDDKEVVESDEPPLIKLMEEYENEPEEDNIYYNMLDDINSDEYTDDESEEDKTGEDEEEMYNDPDFQKAVSINSELNEFNESFTSVKNPYFALNALRDFLFNFNLILPHFDLPSNYDEWVLDVSLKNKSDFVKSQYICHIEILNGYSGEEYSVNAGIYPK